MKILMRRGAAAIHSTFILFVCCASAAAPPALVIDRSVVTFDRLHPAESPLFEQVFVRDPLDLGKYDGLMIESAPSNYRHVDSQSNDPIVVLTPEQRDRFENLLSDTVGVSLRASTPFEIADRPSTNVLILWGTLVDINVHKEADGNLGELILVMELRDSMSQDTLVRAIHHYRSPPLDLADPDRNYAKLQKLSEDIAQDITTGLSRVIAAK